MSSLIESFSAVQDPRMDRTRAHPLLNIIFIAICGADSWVEIESFGKAKQAWLSNYLDLSNGIPSQDTFGRVFAKIDAEQFQAGFRDWIAGVAKQLNAQVIAIDGKKLRRSLERSIGKNAIHMVSVWATEAHLVLVQNQFGFDGIWAIQRHGLRQAQAAPPIYIPCTRRHNYPTSWPSTDSGRASTLPEPVEGKTRQFSFDFVLVHRGINGLPVLTCPSTGLRRELSRTLRVRQNW